LLARRQHGLATLRGRILSRGAVWGTDFVLKNLCLRSPYAATALTYVQCYTFTRAALFHMLPSYPAVAQHVRRHVCWLAVRRYILVESERARAVARSALLAAGLSSGAAGGVSPGVLGAAARAAAQALGISTGGEGTAAAGAGRRGSMSLVTALGKASAAAEMAAAAALAVEQTGGRAGAVNGAEAQVPPRRKSMMDLDEQSDDEAAADMRLIAIAGPL
jgi:hypothetical protein